MNKHTIKIRKQDNQWEIELEKKREKNDNVMLEFEILANLIYKLAYNSRSREINVIIHIGKTKVTLDRLYTEKLYWYLMQRSIEEIKIEHYKRRLYHIYTYERYKNVLARIKKLIMYKKIKGDVKELLKDVQKRLMKKKEEEIKIYQLVITNIGEEIKKEEIKNILKGLEEKLNINIKIKVSKEKNEINHNK